MDNVLGALVNGLVLGSQYGLFAVGLALVLGSMKIFNLGHPVLFVGGGYATLLLSRAEWTSSIPVPFVILLGGLLGGVVTGLVLEVAVLGPLRRSGKGDDITVALATVGFTLAAVSALGLYFGTEAKVIELPRNVLFRVQTATVTTVAVLSVVAAVATFVMLWWVLARTRWGLAIRSVADAPEKAELLGLNSARIARVTILGAAVAASIGGALFATNVSAVSPLLGENLMIKGAAIVVVGGLGSVSGAVVLSYAIGLAEVFTVIYIGSGYREVAALTLLIAVLIFKPSGLFGRTELERV